MSRVIIKLDFLPMRKQGADQLCEADQRICFRCTDSTTSLLLKSGLRSVYVGPGRKPRRPVFLRRCSNVSSDQELVHSDSKARPKNPGGKNKDKTNYKQNKLSGQIVSQKYLN